MQKRTKATITLRVLVIGIALIQILDFIIHAVTNQIEPLRVASNVIILLWLTILFCGWLNTKFRTIAISSIGVYLALNVIFLVIYGVTNSEQDGALRVALFLFVFLTVALSSTLILFHGNHAPRTSVVERD